MGADMKNKIFFILAILLIVLTLHNVSSIGITPGRTTLNFEPGLHKEVGFSIINSEHKDIDLMIYVRNDLIENIKLEKEHVSMKASEEAKDIDEENMNKCYGEIEINVDAENEVSGSFIIYK